MYQLYIENSKTYSPKLVGDYEELEDAQARAKAEKEADSTVTYLIEEAAGGFNSYGERLTYEVERG